MTQTRECTESPGILGPVHSAPWIIEVFYDGACPVCRREVAMLKRRDRRSKFKFVDIAAPDFDPEIYGKRLDALMAEIHARLPDGSWIRGVEVFRRLYAEVGFRWLVAISRWPVVSPLLAFGYRLFAKNRWRLKGSCDARGIQCS